MVQFFAETSSVVAGFRLPYGVVGVNDLSRECRKKRDKRTVETSLDVRLVDHYSRCMIPIPAVMFRTSSARLSRFFLHPRACDARPENHFSGRTHDAPRCIQMTTVRFVHGTPSLQVNRDIEGPSAQSRVQEYNMMLFQKRS